RQRRDEDVLTLAAFVGSEPSDRQKNFFAAKLITLKEVIGFRPGGKACIDRVRKHPHAGRIDAVQLQKSTARIAADGGDQACPLCRPMPRSNDRVPRFDAMELKPQRNSEKAG